MNFIKPEIVKVKDLDENEHTFIISRFPAIAGREIIAKYPVSNIPKLGEYLQSKEAMLMLMKYVAKVTTDDESADPFAEGNHIVLNTTAAIDNHVPDSQTLLKLEFVTLQYNTNFFGKGGMSGLVASLLAKYQPWITSTLTALLPASLMRDLRRMWNSEKK